MWRTSQWKCPVGSGISLSGPGKKSEWEKKIWVGEKHPALGGNSSPKVRWACMGQTVCCQRRRGPKIWQQSDVPTVIRRENFKKEDSRQDPTLGMDLVLWVFRWWHLSGEFQRGSEDGNCISMDWRVRWKWTKSLNMDYDSRSSATEGEQ